MSAHTEEVEHITGATTLTFTKVWIVLLVLTLVEVFLAYQQPPQLIMLTILMGLSLIKAAMIVAYFMHLKFERFSLFVTLIPMTVLCICLMLVFSMPDASRLLQLRH